MPAAAKSKRSGSRHRDRVMVAVRGGVYEQLRKSAVQSRRSISWELASILLAHFVGTGQITQAQADQLWEETMGPHG